MVDQLDEAGGCHTAKYSATIKGSQVLLRATAKYYLT